MALTSRTAQTFSVQWAAGASGNTFTSAIELTYTRGQTFTTGAHWLPINEQDARPFSHLYFHREAMASVCTVYVQASLDGTNWFYPLADNGQTYPIGSQVTMRIHYDTSVSGYFAPVPAGFSYYRFEAASLPTLAVGVTMVAY